MNSLLRASSRRAGAVLVLVAQAFALGACYPDGAPGGAASARGNTSAPSDSLSATAFSIDGDRLTAANPTEALLQHAPRLIPCKKEEVTIRKAMLGSPHSPLRVYLVDGCGQRLIYATTPTEFETSSALDELILISRLSTAPPAQ